jgi:hypothetical protein
MKAAAENRPQLGLFRTLMLFVVAAWLLVVVRLWYQTIDDTRDSLTHVNSMLAQSVRTTLNGHELILRGLGGELISLGALQTPERGRGLIERIKAIDPGMAGFGLARTDGQLLLVSGIPAGTRLPDLGQRAESSASFREALDSKQLRTGRPYYFDKLGHWVVPIRVAVRDAFGKPIAVMTAGYSISGGTTAWANMTLPPGVGVALMRDDGYLNYRQPLDAGVRAEVLQDTYGRPVAAETLAQVRAQRETSTFSLFNLPRIGGAHYVAYTRLQEYGLHSAAFILRSLVIVHWLQRLLAPTALLLVFLAGGVAAYRAAGRRQADSDSDLAKSRRDLLERNESLSLLNRLSQRLHGSLALDDILRETERALLGTSQTPHIAIYLLDREAKVLRLSLSHGFQDALNQIGSSLPLEGSLSGLALARGEPVASNDIAHDIRLEPTIQSALVQVGIRSGVAIPMVCQGESLGVINLVYEQDHRFTKTERETLVSLSNSVALAIANARHIDNLAFQARHDSLTGLANRAVLHEPSRSGSLARRRRKRMPRCCCWTSTASRKSTTPSATTSATRCSPRSARAWNRPARAPAR